VVFGFDFNLSILISIAQAFVQIERATREYRKDDRRLSSTTIRPSLEHDARVHPAEAKPVPQ
jgi:hypothetical protein